VHGVGGPNEAQVSRDFGEYAQLPETDVSHGFRKIESNLQKL
jgi:hypothetical protein